MKRLINKTELNEKQNLALQMALDGKNIFVTGGAGTGKTVLLRILIEMFKSIGKSVIVCAYTGMAAIQVGGVTINRAFGASIHPIVEGDKAKKMDAIVAADVIIIDEISICRFDLFEYVCRCIQKAEKSKGKQIQMIVSGDFYQLPPVMLPKDALVLQEGWPGINIGAGYAFHAGSWRERNFHLVELTDVMRQDSEDFVNNLNQIRVGNIKAIDWFNACASQDIQPGIYLYPTNRAATRKNEEELRKLNQSMRSFVAINNHYKDPLPADEILKLCKGARVMTLVNDAYGLYQNGSLGTIIRIDYREVAIALDNGHIVTVGPYEWTSYEYGVTEGANGKKKLEKIETGSYIQLPLKIAYAVTIHKSQGQTYDSANVNPSCFANGQLYVAISRVRDINNMHLLTSISPDDLKVAQEVIDFYAMLSL